jgi:hypothetical protein
MELSDTVALSTAASAKCDFSGKSHSNIIMEDSAKVALFASDTVRPPESSAVRPEAIGHRSVFAMINDPLPIPPATGLFETAACFNRAWE